VQTPATIVLQIAVAERDGVTMTEHLAVTDDGGSVEPENVPAPVGGRQHLLHLRRGTVNINYRATINADATAARSAVTPAERARALRPSRYSPSDRFAGFASARFGELPAGLPRVRAICDYVWRHVLYLGETSDSTTDAVDTLLAARGVCRDFAHLVAALCRAVEVPARIASVYAPGLSPMDFHAVVETEIDGRWWVWDATRSAPRQAMLRIATGRDAADTAFTSVLSGRAELTSIEIIAIADGDLPLDDHDQIVALA
jgi:transglutaminase-like putative cysteine protease